MSSLYLSTLRNLSLHGHKHCLRAFATHSGYSRPPRQNTVPLKTGQYAKAKDMPPAKLSRPAKPAFNNGIKDALKRVPRSKEVFLIEKSSKEPKKVSLSAIQLQPGEFIRILNETAPKDEGSDPQLFIRVESTVKPSKERAEMSKEDAKKEKKEKKERKDKQKGPEQRQIQLSWGISKHDIGHKSRVVDAFFAKGDSVMVTIKPSRSQQYQSVDGLVLESRQQTLKLVKEMLEKNGKEYKPAAGSYNSSFVLMYKPAVSAQTS